MASAEVKIGNQMFVRHYLWLNYPHEPQLFGIQFPCNPKGPGCRSEACDGGKYAQGQSGDERLLQELRELGFEWNAGLKMWTIAKSSIV